MISVTKTFGIFYAAFEGHLSKVINGFSDFIVAVFGEKGKHARVAVGVGSLPGNIPVEVDMIVEVQN